MEQNTNAKMPKNKHDKIQKKELQITKIQMQQNTYSTKYNLTLTGFKFELLNCS